jgi:hypothetical protein
MTKSKVIKTKLKNKTIKNIIIVLSILILITGLAVGIWLLVKHFSSNNSNRQTPGPSLFPTENILATWSSDTNCGRGTFDIISLASALPQNFNIDDIEDFFTLYIVGDYDRNMSNGLTKYIISVGGSNASPEGWKKMLNDLSIENNINKFYNECINRGVVGIDWDLEQTDSNMTTQINNINLSLKRINPNYIIMLTIFLGSPSTFASLLNGVYDYLSLMLYNGGMYSASGAGAGCDWDGWAELLLSKGLNGCKNPLFENSNIYSKDANLTSINPKKILLGLIVDTVGERVDSNIYRKSIELNKKYGGSGIIFWVLPGWQKNDNIAKINEITGLNIKCEQPSTDCKKPSKPCNGSCNCLATSCGKTQQGVTDKDCQACPEQSWWPCNKEGLCQCI